jgi:chromosome segregation ATPase
MIELKAPIITPAERRRVAEAKAAIETQLASAEKFHKKIMQLREKERDLRSEAEELDRKARNFDRAAEKELASVSRQLERISEAIDAAEAADDGLAPASIQEAQELVSTICQRTYEELLDRQAEAMAPFWAEREAARQIGRTSTAVQMLINQLMRGIGGEDTYAAAEDVLAKLDALLHRKVIWTFESSTAS